jgi:hypothetical protein
MHVLTVSFPRIRVFLHDWGKEILLCHFDQLSDLAG